MSPQKGNYVWRWWVSELPVWWDMWVGSLEGNSTSIFQRVLFEPYWMVYRHPLSSIQHPLEGPGRLCWSKACQLQNSSLPFAPDATSQPTNSPERQVETACAEDVVFAPCQRGVRKRKVSYTHEFTYKTPWYLPTYLPKMVYFPTFTSNIPNLDVFV